MKPELSICEELLLLSLDDEKGKLVNSSSEYLSFAMAGAVLFELMLLGKLELSDGKVVSLPKSPMGDEVFDLAIARFAKQTKPKALKYWIHQVAKDVGKIEKVLHKKLMQLGALREENRTFLWVFNYNRYPTDDSRIEDRVRRRIVESLFGDAPVDPRDYILLLLVGASKLESEVFIKEQVSEARTRIKALGENDELGTAISALIKEFEAAMVVIFTAAVTSTVVSS